MRSNTWRVIILFSLTLVLVSTAMDAQAARRSSLAGNQFINDADDMFAFPQLTMKYKNRIIIDMGQADVVRDGDGDVLSSTQRGNGSIIFGDNMVWNFNTGRGNFLNNTASWAIGGVDRYNGMVSAEEGMGWNGIPGSNGSNGTQLEWWDVGMATHLGDTPFGFNISYATSGTEEKPADATVPATDTSTSMLSLQLGVTFGSVDIAGEVGFGSYTDESTPASNPTDLDDYSFFNFALLARGDLEDVGGLDWRWIGSFASGSNDPQWSQADPALSAEKLSTTSFRASFGPVWGTPGEWEVAAYMNFHYLSHDMEVNDFVYDRVDNNSYMSFPGYNIAMEYYLNSWLVARGGIMSESSSKTETRPNAGDPITENETKSRENMLMWTLGMGVDKGNWGLDLALEEDNVHSGYLPLNGDQSGLDHPIAYMSAWLSW